MSLSASTFIRADGSRRRVLYAEDQATSRIVTKAMLERMGFHVDAVEDGELALQRARNDNYDVILLDIEMPVMDGATAARSIRKELTHCEGTPILALSAFLADSTEHSQWRDAFDQALPKPANGNELLKAMTSAVAFKDSKAVKISARPSNDELADALRAALPATLWKRIRTEAALEMRHLANVMEAAKEACDAALIKQVASRLNTLAQSFGVGEVSRLAEKLSKD